MSQTAQQLPEDDSTIIHATETMLGDLMACVLDLAKALPKPWAELSESEQDNWLASVDGQCAQAVRQCVRIIAADGKVVVPGVVDSVTFKDGVKVVLKLMAATEGAHAVADAEGDTVYIAIADASQYTGPEGKPEAEPDQRAMELEGAA